MGKLINAVIDYCAKIIDVLVVWWYLNRYALGNVKNELNIGVVVVVSPSWHRYIMICHLDVLCEVQANHL